jgi:hypothetical protein
VVATLAWAAAPAQAITPTTTTVTYTGAEQTFRVPGGVTSISVVAIGGTGGDATDSVGGAAAEVTGNITVTPGATLYVEVGGLGEDIGEGGAGGFNGGGAGGGGGGGASDVRTAPRSTSLLIEDNRLIVAAGGGGGGGSGPSGTGANGGAAGEAGSNSEIYLGGGAGTPFIGGAGAAGCGSPGPATGGNGALGEGGAGGNAGAISGPGGGGGGGFYGGGGGGGSCELGSSGGGGGSSLVPPLGLAAHSSAAPKVELTYTLVPPTIEIASPANGATYQQGEVVKASYSCTPPEGTTVESCEGPVANGAALDTSTLGPHPFEVEAEDKDGAAASEEVTYTVVAPPSISITTPTNGATYTQGQAVTAIYSCTPAGGTGVKTCAGPVANGAALDTAALGPHSFEVKAEDLDGGKATQSASYTVVSPKQGPPPPPVAPDTVLGSHPKKTIKTDKQKVKVKVKFSFSSNVTGASFKCKLDKGAFAPCTSPKSYKVKLGRHTFSVEAVSAGGTDPAPATFSFKVKKKT